MLNNLKDLVERHDVISFDVFDTLILRNLIDPQDLFLVLEQELAKRDMLLKANFAEIRQIAEKKARDEFFTREDKWEITISDIYEKIIELNCIDRGNVHNAIHAEEQLEIKLTCPRYEIQQIFKYATHLGKRIIIITDIYLPRAVITAILTRADYHEYAELYISNEVNKTKASGSLYEHVLAKEKYRPRDILHIGDNYQSDVINAKRYGFHSIHVNKVKDLAQKHDVLSKYLKAMSQEEPMRHFDPLQKVFIGFLINQYEDKFKVCKDTKNYWFNFGYSFGGFVHYCFIEWLINQINRETYQHIFFLSRDGALPLKIYNIFSHFYKLPEATYLLTSRRCLNFARITKIDQEAMDFLVSGTTKMQVRDYLSRIGLTIDTEILELLKKVGFSNASELVKSNLDFMKLRSLFYQLEERIISQSNDERQALLAYLEKMGFKRYKKIAIVDVGWHGSMQQALQDVLKIGQMGGEIKGFYVGLWQNAIKYIKKGNRMRGFFCEYGVGINNEDNLKKCVELIELLFTDGTRSLDHFHISARGVPIPIYVPDDLTDIEQKTNLQQMHDGIVSFIEDFAPIAISLNLYVNPNTLGAIVGDFLEQPPRKDAILLGNLIHIESFGNQGQKRYIARPPRNPLNVIRGYKSAYWKRGFIRRTSFLYIVLSMNKLIRLVLKQITH